MSLVVVAGFLAVLLPVSWFVLGRMQEPRVRARSQDNLRQIGRAMLKYSEDHDGYLPPAVLYDTQGRSLHSWRVLLLPYLGKQSLYERFRLDEPWDSPHNKALMREMPDVYVPPRSGATMEPFATFYQVCDGTEAFDSSSFPKFRAASWKEMHVDSEAERKLLLRAQSNRVPFLNATPCSLLIEAKEAVPWTKPQDICVTCEPLPPLGGLFDGDFFIVTADGDVRFVEKKKISEDHLKKLIFGEPHPFEIEIDF